MRRSGNKLLQGIWKESVIAGWETLWVCCAERLRETSNTLVEANGVRPEIWTRDHLNTKQEAFHPTATLGGKVYNKLGRGSSVGVGTRYGLEGPEIKSRWGRDLPHRFQSGPGAHPATCIVGTRCFLGVQRLGRGVDHPPPLTPKLKK